MKEKLIKLFEQFSFTCYTHCKKAGEYSCKECQHEQLADYLIQNGVVVPPCKAGDVMYSAWENSIDEYHITKIEIVKNDLNIYYQIDGWDDDDFFIMNDIGKTVFLTREEAERALKECEQCQ